MGVGKRTTEQPPNSRGGDSVGQGHRANGFPAPDPSSGPWLGGWPGRGALIRQGPTLSPSRNSPRTPVRCTGAGGTALGVSPERVVGSYAPGLSPMGVGGRSHSPRTAVTPPAPPRHPGGEKRNQLFPLSCCSPSSLFPCPAAAGRRIASPCHPLCSTYVATAK